MTVIRKDGNVKMWGIYFRFLPFFAGLEGVAAGVVAVVGASAPVRAAPLGAFVAEGIGVFGNAAKDEDIA